MECEEFEPEHHTDEVIVSTEVWDRRIVQTRTLLEGGESETTKKSKNEGTRRGFASVKVQICVGVVILVVPGQ